MNFLKLVLGAALFFGSTLVASADYYISKIRNDSGYTVGAKFRWGNGQWKTFTMAPGSHYNMWLDTKYGKRTLYINFDSDPGPGQRRCTYWLRTYRNPWAVYNGWATELFFTRSNGCVDLQNTRGL